MSSNLSIGASTPIVSLRDQGVVKNPNNNPQFVSQSEATNHSPVSGNLKLANRLTQLPISSGRSDLTVDALDPNVKSDIMTSIRDINRMRQLFESNLHIVNETDWQGEATLLHYAAEEASSDVFVYLLAQFRKQAGFVSMRDSRGNTALHNILESYDAGSRDLEKLAKIESFKRYGDLTIQNKGRYSFAYSSKEGFV